MADITVTANQVGLIDPMKAVLINCIAGVALTSGQEAYLDTNSGKWLLADGSAAATVNMTVTVSESVGANQAFTGIKEGGVYGYSVSALNYGTPVYISDTAGALGTTVGDATVPRVVGRIMPLSDSDMTKVVYFDHDWNTESS